MEKLQADLATLNLELAETEARQHRQSGHTIEERISLTSRVLAIRELLAFTQREIDAAQ